MGGGPAKGFWLPAVSVAGLVIGLMAESTTLRIVAWVVGGVALAVCVVLRRGPGARNPEHMPDMDEPVNIDMDPEEAPALLFDAEEDDEATDDE